MKKLLNTVYVTSEGAALKKDGENLVAEVDGVERARVPLHMLASVVAFGPILISPALIGICAERGITIALLDRVGRFQARIEGPVSGNVLLRRAQYRIADTAEDIVRSLVIGKVANQRAVIRRALRDYGDEMALDARLALERATDRMAMILRRVQLSDSTIDQMRGSEGEAARHPRSLGDQVTRHGALGWRRPAPRPRVSLRLARDQSATFLRRWSGRHAGFHGIEPDQNQGHTCLDHDRHRPNPQ